MRRGGPMDMDAGEAKLIADLYPRLRSFASVVAPAEEDPNDLVQEAFVRTLRGGSLSRLEYPKAYLRTTIYHLAVSAAATGRRNVRRWSASSRIPIHRSTRGRWRSCSACLRRPGRWCTCG